MCKKKVYVDVVVKISSEGAVTPKSIIWDDGRCFEIDRVGCVKRYYADKVGGTGMRYTIYVNNKETYLFEDEGKWFVEAK